MRVVHDAATSLAGFSIDHVPAHKPNRFGIRGPLRAPIAHALRNPRAHTMTARLDLLAASCALLAISLTATTAHAQEVTVPAGTTLSTGAPLPGEVTAVRVGIDVTVRLPDGSLRTVPWSEIHLAASDTPVRVRVSAGPAEPHDAIDTSEFSRTARSGDAMLVLESDGGPLAISAFDNIVDANAPASADTSLRAHRRFLCATPCTIFARPGTHSIHMGGEGLADRDVSVALDPSGTRVRLRASSVWRPLGAITSFVYGTPAAIGGIAFFGFGISAAAHGGTLPGSCSASVSAGGASASTSSTNGCDVGFLFGVGSGLLLSGAGLLVLGAHFAATSGSGVVESIPLGYARANRTPRWLARVRFMGAGVARVAEGRGAMGSVGVAF